MSDAVNHLAKDIKRLTLAEQLRLAAALLDHGKNDLAETVAENVVTVLKARRLLGKVAGAE